MTTTAVRRQRPAATDDRPRVALTMGDGAGVGPEIMVRAWSNPALHRQVRPIAVGNSSLLKSLADHFAPALDFVVVESVDAAEPAADRIVCLDPCTTRVDDLPIGQVHSRAGQAAFDCLCAAIDLAQLDEIDAIVTMPLNKEGLHAAGLKYPGHTEILAERTGVANFAMMLYRQGLGVVHVTLHTALRDVFAALSIERIVEKIGLLDRMMRRLGKPTPRLAVAALNPHAGDGGLFGDEEARLIAPAVARGRADGANVIGPLPADTLFVRASRDEFDGVVAMYHDQGHIALKLLGWREAVNITCGLPIIRTSVAHGTAYDIAGQGRAELASFFEAVGVAAQLAEPATNRGNVGIGHESRADQRRDAISNRQEVTTVSETTLYLARHGATDANLKRPYVLQGQHVDLELSELGRQQVAALGKALEREPIVAVYASPLIRAMRTAAAIAGPRGQTIRPVPELAEVDVGQWEGMNWDDVGRQWPNEYAAFLEDPSRSGYLGGENFEQVRARTIAALDAIAARHAGETIAVVAHHAVNRCAVAHWLGIPVSLARTIPQNNGGVNVVQYLKGRGHVRTVNSAWHLASLIPPD